MPFLFISMQISHRTGDLWFPACRETRSAWRQMRITCEMTVALLSDSRHNSQPPQQLSPPTVHSPPQSMGMVRLADGCSLDIICP